jgi:ferric-dicitrate binding protein FerR (iron transport regulator)
MQENNIDEILRRVLTGEATGEEVALLNKWLAESDENQQIFHQLQMILQERAPESLLSSAGEISERIWNEAIHGKTDLFYKRERSSIFHYQHHWLKLAAIVLLVIGLPLFIFTYTQLEQPSSVAEVTPIEKKTTIGQKSKILLPDGSIVWLNAESKVTYAADFEGNQRALTLEGEAYFEVKKDKLKPFIVLSGKISTTAIGTSFNISAYPEDSTIEVALITGKVQVKSPTSGIQGEAFVLNEGNGVNYNIYRNQARKYTFDKHTALAWKQGILLFEGDSFEEVTRKIRRWYGVEVTVTGIPPDDWKLTGRFKNELLTSVLENIRFGRNFTYHLDGKQLNLHFEPRKP